MDVSFTNVVEGTRPYFLGLPNPSSPGRQTEEKDGARWCDTPPAAEAQSGAPAMPNSRPPSVAAVQPPRPPSEGMFEPEPHIIHKATVVQQALQKEREEALLRSQEELERPPSEMGMSPPTHEMDKSPPNVPEANNKSEEVPLVISRASLVPVSQSPTKITPPAPVTDNIATISSQSSPIVNIPTSPQVPQSPHAQIPPSPLNAVAPSPRPAVIPSPSTVPSPSTIIVQSPTTRVAPSPTTRVAPSPTSLTNFKPPSHTPSPHPRTPTPVSFRKTPEEVTRNDYVNYHRMEQAKPTQYLHPMPPRVEATSRYQQDVYHRPEQSNQSAGRYSAITPTGYGKISTSAQSNVGQVQNRITTTTIHQSQQGMIYSQQENIQKGYRPLNNSVSSSTFTTTPPIPNDRVPPIQHPGGPPTHHQVKSKNTTSSTYNQQYATVYRQQSQYNTSYVQPIQSGSTKKYDSRDPYSSYAHPSQQPRSMEVHYDQRQYHEHRMESRVNVQHVKPNTQMHHYPPGLPESIPQRELQPNYPSSGRQPTSNIVENTTRNSYQYPTSHSQASNIQYSQSTQKNISSYSQSYQSSSVSVTARQDSQSRITTTRNSTSKSGYTNHQPRMKVSVTSLVDQINQSKKKRESPLDLSVKTVKNPADSTAQDDGEHSTYEELIRKSIDQSKYNAQPTAVHSSSRTSLKVDFSPNFHSYNDKAPQRSAPENCYYKKQSYHSAPAAHQNRAYEVIPSKPYVKKPPPEPYIIDNRYQIKSKYNPLKRPDAALPRIDLTQAMGKEHFRDMRPEYRQSEESRKRLNGPVVSNVPEKLLRYETWSSDSRIERMSASRSLSESAQEQHKLMSQPVYSYSAYRQFENNSEPNKSIIPQNTHEPNQINYPSRQTVYDRQREYEKQRDFAYNQKLLETQGRQIIHRIPNPRYAIEQHNGVPADKNVLSILRNSLEDKTTTGLHARSEQIAETIVIDDGDDDIEITHISKKETVLKEDSKTQSDLNVSHKLQMPRAVDSIRYENDISNNQPSNDVIFVQNHNNNTPQIVHKSPEAESSRIRTKAELKGFTMPSEQNNICKTTANQNDIETPSVIKPKSQKQHLFNQLQQETEAQIFHIQKSDEDLPEIKVTEDIILETVKTEEIKETSSEEDLLWANACENFVEQLKTGVGPKKKQKKRKLDTDNEKSKEPEKDKDSGLCEVNDERKENINLLDNKESLTVNQHIKSETTMSKEYYNTADNITPIRIKQEPLSDNMDDFVVPTINEDLKIKKEKASPGIENIDFPLIENIKKEVVDLEVNNKEADSSDDDQPLIKSKIMKEKRSLKEKSKNDITLNKKLYIKLEACDITKKTKSHDNKGKLKSKGKSLKKSLSMESSSTKSDRKSSSIDSDSDESSLATRLRNRKISKSDEVKTHKTSNKSPKKCDVSAGKKPGFGDGSDFHPGWEEELYRYKRSLRMPSRLINVPKNLARISSSLPDLDTNPISPAPSTSTEEFFSRRHMGSIFDNNEKANDSDLESTCSSLPKINYDSETSNSTVFSNTSKSKKNRESISDILIQKYGRKDDSKKKTQKDDTKAKIIPKSSNTAELLPTPSLNTDSITGNANAKKDKTSDDLINSFRKETVTEYRNAFIKNSDKKHSDQKEYSTKSRIRTESRLTKHRVSIKEVFGDDRPASAPPLSRDDNPPLSQSKVKRKDNEERKNKLKKKILKDKTRLKSSCNIREGLRSTRSKVNDAKGRMLRLKKRNNLIKSMSNKKMRKIKKEGKSHANSSPEIKKECKELSPDDVAKRKFRRLFARRKFSSGFDYLKKKKKVIRKDDEGSRPIRKPGPPKAAPSCMDDLHKEIKGWIINKSIGETPLHRAARLGYTDCVAYCLEKMDMNPSCSDNAGFTPLHLAAAHGHLHIAKLLLQYGANVSAAASGGIRPLHEACENDHIEMIRLLLSYGSDPRLSTYGGATPVELAQGEAARLIEQHIKDTEGISDEPWYFAGPSKCFDLAESGCDVIGSPPNCSPSPPPSPLEFITSKYPLPPLYTLRHDQQQYCLLQDLAALLQVKSKDALLKQIHSGTGSPKDCLKELKTQDFLERAQCHQLFAAGEKVNIRASKIALIPYTEKVKELLDVESVLVR